MPSANPWPLDLDRKCRELAEAGLSAAEISSALILKSRNAVIGYCKRKNISLSWQRRRKREKQAPVSFDAAKAATVQIKNIPPQRLSFSPMKTCQFIPGEPQYRKFCGRRVFSGSYCENHYYICVQAVRHG